ncbi:hypothetical protein UN64_07405 [Fictibacillus arsenicus]|uniref:Uncharacterized protein n=1 Tax=Fictibacillus arsenicus TaxID=255247 RepID=A0A1V3G6B7_9BACL|nr:hypothetical protein UN64_07405 [Fictibacillus arsenicus]
MLSNQPVRKRIKKIESNSIKKIKKKAELSFRLEPAESLLLLKVIGFQDARFSKMYIINNPKINIHSEKSLLLLRHGHFCLSVKKNVDKKRLVKLYCSAKYDRDFITRCRIRYKVTVET